jgi:hypothetical protein
LQSAGAAASRPTTLCACRAWPLGPEGLDHRAAWPEQRHRELAQIAHRRPGLRVDLAVRLLRLDPEHPGRVDGLRDGHSPLEQRGERAGRVRTLSDVQGVERDDGADGIGHLLITAGAGATDGLAAGALATGALATGVVALNRRFLRLLMPSSRISRATRLRLTSSPFASSSACTRGLP